MNFRNLTNEHSMMAENTKMAVKAVLILVAFGLIIYDIYLYATDGATISRVIHDSAEGRNFWLTFVWGVLGAHLFLAREEKKKIVGEGLGILILVGITFLLFFLGRSIPQVLGVGTHLILLVFGAVMGFFFWPQNLPPSGRSFLEKKRSLELKK